jgi:hypothetical protein
VEASLRHPDAGEAWEYSMMISVKNERGEEVTRQIVGVGALQPGEGRTFSFAVEVFAPSEAKEPAGSKADTPIKPTTPGTREPGSSPLIKNPVPVKPL